MHLRHLLSLRQRSWRYSDARPPAFLPDPTFAVAFALAPNIFPPDTAYPISSAGPFKRTGTCTRDKCALECKFGVDYGVGAGTASPRSVFAIWNVILAGATLIVVRIRIR